MSASPSIPVAGAGHPAFFNGSILAEVLPDGLYRFTKTGEDGSMATIQINPTIGRAHADYVDKDGSPIHGDSFHPLPKFYTEAKALLHQNGYEVEKNPAVTRELSELMRRVVDGEGISPDSAHPGDCLVAPLTGVMDGGWGFAMFRVAKEVHSDGADGFECRDPVIYKEYTDGHTSLSPGGNEYKTSWWKTTGKYLRVDDAQFDRLQKISAALGEKSAFEEGRKIFGDAVIAFYPERNRAYFGLPEPDARFSPEGSDDALRPGGVAV